METFTYISCVILGIALGVGGDWLFWQIRFKQANERVRAESQAVGKAFNAQIEEKERQLMALQVELAGLRESSQADLVAVRGEVAVLQNRFADQGQQLGEAHELNKKLPLLEKEIADRQAALVQLQAEKSDLADVIDGLQVKIVEERKAFEEGLVYVQGSHYLPASVVRNLTSSQELVIDPGEGEEEL